MGFVVTLHTLRRGCHSEGASRLIVMMKGETICHPMLRLYYRRLRLSVSFNAVVYGRYLQPVQVYVAQSAHRCAMAIIKTKFMR